MTRLKSALAGVAGIVMAAGVLAGCDNPSAVETRDRTVSNSGLALSAVADPSTSGTAQAATEAASKPVLTANRRETVDAKITRLYERNGADFGARSPQDYLTKVTAFTARPPSDAETVQRPNGDTLIYQASSNTFAVVARDGTPRTMFKPTTGASYWAEQKAAAPSFGQRRAARAD